MNKSAYKIFMQINKNNTELSSRSNFNPAHFYVKYCEKLSMIYPDDYFEVIEKLTQKCAIIYALYSNAVNQLQINLNLFIDY